MSRIALSADWHSRGVDHVLFDAQLQALVDRCIEEQIEILAVAGDLYDHPSIGDEHASTGRQIATINRELHRLVEQDVDVLLISGNHDLPPTGEAGALHAQDGRSGVYVVHYQPEMVSLREVGFLCVPWSWFPRPVPEMLNGLGIADAQILLAHVRVPGALVREAVPWLPTRPEWAIGQDELHKLGKHLALGDFHRRQELVDGRGGYVGALRQLDWRNAGDPQGFEILETDTGERTWIELDKTPYHRIVELEPGESPPEPRPNEKIIARFSVKPDAATEHRLEEQGIRVQYRQDGTERARRADVPAGVIHDNDALVRLWADAQELDEQRVDRMLRLQEQG